MPYNLSSSLPSRGQKYDIVDGKVIALGVASAAPRPRRRPPVLAAKENATVVYAAMNRAATTAVFVRRATDGRLLRQSWPATASACARSGLPDPGQRRRPPGLFIDNDHFLLPYAGKLWEVATAGGAPIDVTPSNRVGNVRAYLGLAGRPTDRVRRRRAGLRHLAHGGRQRHRHRRVQPAPDRWPARSTAAAVAWISEGWLYVSGTSVIPGQTASAVVYRATADGVVALNESAALAGLPPDRRGGLPDRAVLGRRRPRSTSASTRPCTRSSPSSRSSPRTRACRLRSSAPESLSTVEDLLSTGDR